MKDTDQTRSPSYRLAFADPEFLFREAWWRRIVDF